MSNMAESTSATSSYNENGVPLVFMREFELFGRRRPEREEWLSHVELYKAIATRISPNNIKGLQRIGPMWRIYIDNIDDKVKLMTEGIPLRNKTIRVLPTHPGRLDSESTTKVRVKNVPLSVDDGVIERALTLQKVEVIKLFREKLRIDEKLTNCETGDRLVIAKSSSLITPLPPTLMIAQFTARVFHPGQHKTGPPSTLQCTKCLQPGHSSPECQSERVCGNCKKTGHIQSECPISYSDAEAEKDSSGESSGDQSDSETIVDTPQRRVVESKRSASSLQKDTSHAHGQQSMKQFVTMKSSSDQSTETPNKGKQSCAPARSPPTPVEVIHDKTLQSKKKKK